MAVYGCSLTRLLRGFIVLLMIVIYNDTRFSSASIDRNVLVASIQQATDQFNINLPVGSPAQKLQLKIDVESPSTAIRCSSNSSSAFDPFLSSSFRSRRSLHGETCTVRPVYPAQHGCKCAHDTVNLYIQRTAFPDALLSANVTAVSFACCKGRLGGDTDAGVAGFGRGDKSLPMQISKRAGLAYQFSYCLPSIAFFGRVSSYAYLNPPIGQLQTLIATPQTNLYYRKNGGYAFKLTNITISGEVLKYPIMMGISTTQRYTTLQAGVYETFRENFRKAVEYEKTAMPAVAPFDTCFNTTYLYQREPQPGPYLKQPGVGFRNEGDESWTLYPETVLARSKGSSSPLACMAFLKAKPKQISVLGWFQQLDCLLQFDIENSLFGIRSIFSPYAIRPEVPRCNTLLYPLFPST
ncbi:hypothetical protein KP509_16G054300 [Ceratopteris richardii]|uniref:Peptidase A1 domain-containing protein n=1 Tax=Ceratopteris richardii TaxID=49495 RepID=A0A8T2T4N9_CERRI|nr:hypothetical protein KP509_16G054300 [Ceratopteris richardii]